MRLFQRAMALLKEDGIKAACYASLYKFREHQKEQIKYDKWIQRFEYQMPVEKTDKYSKEAITLICADENMWDSIESESGDYFAFYFAGDSITKDWDAILSAYIKRHPEFRFIYTDEDIFEDGKRRKPFFKPEWSPDTYMSYDYIGGLLVLERSLAQAAAEVLKQYPEVDARYGTARLYALGLCAAERINRDQIGHLKRVLYHREEKYKYKKDNLINIKNDFIDRNRLNAFSEYEPRSGRVRIVFNANPDIKVSIIIPSKDQAKVLADCIESVERYTNYNNYEFVIVDNGSSSPQKKLYEELAKKTTHQFKYIYESMEFNFARMCNLGAENADGDCLVFMNDDIVFMEKGAHWLSRLVGQAMQEHTGAVGAKLLYPDSSIIQHVGVVNYAVGASHIYWKRNDKNLLPGYRNCLDINCSIVTGALLGVSKNKFQKIGGFCEELKVTYNDVELCLKLLENGYYNIVRSDVFAYHYESLARGEDHLDFEKYRRCLLEREKLFELHPDFIGRDLYYHPYLTQHDLNGSVTTRYLPQISRVKRYSNEPELVGECVIKHRIDCIETEDWTHIKGYAYMKKPGKEKISIILSGKRDFRIETTAVYNHSYTALFNDGRSYAFIGFETVFRHQTLPKDDYAVFIKIGQCMVDTGRRILLKNR